MDVDTGSECRTPSAHELFRQWDNRLCGEWCRRQHSAYGPVHHRAAVSPATYLKYFLQRDVYGDDPFTPEIEPSIPLPLAVMVQNQGYGTAYNFQITSAQPTIVDNQKGLLINFNIIGTEVDGQPVSPPSLTANFGDLWPGAIQIGVWWLTSSLDGQFIGCSATFQNIDPLGNLQLSPIQSVEIHEITHMVWADGAWDDGQPDFLVIDTNNINSLPNLLYLSDGTIQPVSVVQTGTNSGSVTPNNLQIQFTANFPAGFTYVLVPDPANGQFPLQSVLYANGNNFLTNNFWMTDQTFVGLAQPPLLQTNLHLFVYNTNAGPETYTLVYGMPTNCIQTNPPVSAVFSLPAQSPPTFGVVWSGANYVGGAPIAYYQIYVSDDGGPFNLWQSQTTGTGALYNGTQGHTYAFYSIATDTTGNREATPLQPQAQTTVIANTIPPTITVVSNVTLNAGQTLSLNVTASAFNPQSILTFTLGPGSPGGVVVNPTSGQITWATSPTFGGTTNLIRIIATDNGQPPLSATGMVQVVLVQVDNPPVLAPIANYSIYEAQLLVVSNSATDNNLPPKPLAYSLGQGAPTNATIDPVSGLFHWRPTAAQAVTLGPKKTVWPYSTNIISVIVADNGTPPLTATQQFTVVVSAVTNEYTLTLGSTGVLVGVNQFSAGDTAIFVAFDHHNGPVAGADGASHQSDLVVRFAGNTVNAAATARHKSIRHQSCLESGIESGNVTNACATWFYGGATDELRNYRSVDSTTFRIGNRWRNCGQTGGVWWPRVYHRPATAAGCVVRDEHQPYADALWQSRHKL